MKIDMVELTTLGIAFVSGFSVAVVAMIGIGLLIVKKANNPILDGLSK